MDNLIIGKKFGSADLAYYNKSYYLYLYPNNLFAAVLTGVLHPFIREYKDNTTSLYNKYLKVIKPLSLIGLFTMLLFFFCSEEIMLIMFGNNWLPAAACLKCLSICMWTQMMSSVPGTFFMGMERTDQMFKCGIINLSLIIISIMLGVYFESIYTLAFFIGISYNIIFLSTNYILINKTMKFSFMKFLKTFRTDFAFLVISVLFLSLLPDINLANLWLTFILKATIIVVLYSLYIILTNQYKILTSLLISFLHRNEK